MGYFWRQAATLFKGIFMTSRKERSEVHKAEKYGEATSELLNIEFPELLEHRHRVTRFMEKLVTFVKDVKVAGKNCFLVIYNQLSQDMAEEKSVHALLVEDIHDRWRDMPNDKLLKEYEQRMLLSTTQTLQSDVGNERKLYRELEAIMVEAGHPTAEHQDIMDAARTLFKEKESIGNKVEEVVWKRNISQARRRIRNTRKIEKDIKYWMLMIAKSIQKKKSAEVKKEIQKLEGDFQKVSYDIASMYKLSYLVKQRAFLLFMRLLYIAEQCQKYVAKETGKHDAPAITDKQLLEDFSEAMKDLTSDFRVVAQEFRIVIHDLERDIREAESLARAA